MMRKSYLGKLFTFKFPGRKSKITGIVLDYNDDWTFIRAIPDYSPYGFTIFKNDRCIYEYGEAEKFATRILKLKNLDFLRKPNLKLSSLDEILSSIDKKYKLIQLDTKDGEAFDVVKYKKCEDGLYHFDELTTRAKWRYKYTLPEKAIRYISFDNDYLNSLRLITKFKS
jgi:hypothetical protein